MKTQYLRKALWVANAVLLVAAITLAANALGGRGEVAYIDGSGTLEADAAAGERHDRLTDEDVAAITRTGVIVPVPAAPARPQPPAQAVHQPPAQVDALENFRYRLIGTAVGGRMPYAWFEDSTSGRQLGKTLNEQIGDAKVLGIWEDRALVEIGAQKGYLWRVKTTMASAAGPSRPAGRSVVPMAPTATAAPVVVEPEEDPFDDDDLFGDPDQMVMSEAEYADYLRNIGTYLNQITVQSYLGEDGQIAGLILAKVPSESEAYKRGFREGDIVTSIQGEPITDTSTAFRIAHQILKDEDYIVDVTIIRNGIEDSLVYEIWPE